MFGLAPKGAALLPTIDMIKVSVVAVGLKQPLTVNRCSDEVAGKHSIETSKQLILSLMHQIDMELQRIDTRLRPSCL